MAFHAVFISLLPVTRSVPFRPCGVALHRVLHDIMPVDHIAHIARSIMYR
jgi:hypothetical protein